MDALPTIFAAVPPLEATEVPATQPVEGVEGVVEVAPLSAVVMVLVLLGVVTLAARIFGVFRDGLFGGVVGPVRSEREGGLLTAGLAMAGALVAWQLAAVLLFATGYLPVSETGQADELPTDRLLVANLVTYLTAVLAALLVVRNHALFGGGLIRLGLSAGDALKAVPRALLAFGFVMPWMFAAMVALSMVRVWLGYDSSATHELLQELQQTVDARLIGLILVTALVCAPLAEEVLFRGILQTGLGQLYARLAGTSLTTGTSAMAARWFGILLASALFAMLHEPWSIPLIFMLSVMLGWLYERSGNLWLVIFVHFGFNAVNTLLALTVQQ